MTVGENERDCSDTSTCKAEACATSNAAADRGGIGFADAVDAGFHLRGIVIFRRYAELIAFHGQRTGCVGFMTASEDIFQDAGQLIEERNELRRPFRFRGYTFDSIDYGGRVVVFGEDSQIVHFLNHTAVDPCRRQRPV